MPEQSELNAGKKAIRRCMRAWNYAYKKHSAGPGASADLAHQAANAAYLRAMPVLVGYKNICEFIACVNFASTTGIVTPLDAQHFLTNAKIAISVVYQRPPSESDVSIRAARLDRLFRPAMAARKVEEKNLSTGGLRRFRKPM